jgi:hypothetical protein
MTPESNKGLIGGTGWITTSTNLEDKTDVVNTVGKYYGKRMWNYTTSKFVYAVGPAVTDVWNDAVGSLAHTPI